MIDNKFNSARCRGLAQLLNDLENELNKQQLWQEKQPSEAALSSQLPFAIDTLTFPQWLQFIFLEKMNYLLQFDLPLPNSLLVLPMAEEYFANQSCNSTRIIALIGRIDLVIGESENE